MSRIRARLARLARLARVSAAVGATAVVGGLASSEVRSRWYVDLDKPSFQPPDVAFPVAWTALYTDLVLTASWSWTFFRFHRLGPAAVHAGVLTLSSADLVRRTAAVSGPAGVALAPYPAWCGFATALSTALGRRNR